MAFRFSAVPPLHPTPTFIPSRASGMFFSIWKNFPRTPIGKVLIPGRSPVDLSSVEKFRLSSPSSLFLPGVFSADGLKDNYHFSISAFLVGLDGSAAPFFHFQVPALLVRPIDLFSASHFGLLITPRHVLLLVFEIPLLIC